MLLGLALVGSGIYLETVDAKNAAEKASAAAALARPLPLVGREGSGLLDDDRYVVELPGDLEHLS